MSSSMLIMLIILEMLDCFFYFPHVIPGDPEKVTQEICYKKKGQLPIDMLLTFSVPERLAYVMSIFCI